MNKTPLAVVVALSVLLYALSLLLPAYHYGPEEAHKTTQGWECLEIGWFPAIFGLFGLVRGSNEFLGTVTWFVNPMLLGIWVAVFSRSRGLAAIAAFGALALSLGFLGVHTIPVSEGQTQDHIAPALGYGLWVASVALALLAAIVSTLGGESGVPPVRPVRRPRRPFRP